MKSPRRVQSVAELLISGEVRAGMSLVEAGNLVASTYDLHPCESGWTAHEIDALLFLRWRATSRRCRVSS